MKNRWLIALMTAALLAPAAVPAHDDDNRGWRDWIDCDKQWGSGPRHCETQRAEWKATGRPITVDSSPNGGVVVVGWDRDVVEVKAVVQTRGDSQREADDLAKRVDVTMGADRITAFGPRDNSRWSVTFVIHAPRNSDLRLTAHNGPVGVENVKGDMLLETHNGPISVQGCAGNVRAHSQNGPLNVRLAGRTWEGAGLDAETRNGPVHLEIPERYSAVLESGTLNGPMDIDLPVRIRRGRYWTTELGDGGKALRVVTRNGPITVERI